MKEKTNREKILSAKPGKPKVIRLNTVNPASLRQEAYEINALLKAAETPLPEGKKTYYEVNVSYKEGRVTVFNHMIK